MSGYNTPYQKDGSSVQHTDEQLTVDKTAKQIQHELSKKNTTKYRVNPFLRVTLSSPPDAKEEPDGPNEEKPIEDGPGVIDGRRTMLAPTASMVL